jgi:hypothetical protein
MELSMVQRRAVTNQMATKYRQASRSEKSVVLDQFVELTGWHRGWARAQLRQAGTIRVPTLVGRGTASSIDVGPPVEVPTWWLLVGISSLSRTPEI